MINTFEANRLIHVPATRSPGDIKLTYPSSAASLGEGKQCSWWSKNPLLPYNAMLVSAYFGMSTIKNRDEIRENVLFFGDSGGFQVLQNKLDPTKHKDISKILTWEKVIQWQLKVCDIGMTLDIPTPREWYQIDNTTIFEDRLKETKKNALAMHEYKEKNIGEAHNSNFKLLNCLHGAYLDQMERWYKETTDNFNIKYDGFAAPGSKTMKSVLALRLGFAIEHSEGKPFHLLGIASPSSIALIAYANKYTNTQISFDTSSASYGRIIRKYMLFWNFAGGGVSLKEKPKYEKYYSLECPCPICTQLERPEDLWELGTTSGILITLHNLFWMNNYTAFVNNLVHYEDEFIEYVKWLTREPADNPYKPPKNIEKYVAGIALEQGDYSYGSDEAYNLDNDLNLPDSVKNGTISQTAPVFAREELLKEWAKMSSQSKFSSWILQYMQFLDDVHEKDLSTAWDRHFKKNESNDPFLIDDSNTENDDYFILQAENNLKIRDLQKSATFGATTAFNDMMRTEILNPYTQEVVKVGELAEEDLAQISTSVNNKSKKKPKKVGGRAPIISNESFE